MANYTVSGNIGGTAGSGASIQLTSLNDSLTLFGSADTSGNFTFTVPDKATYNLVAAQTGYSIRQQHQVIVNGANVSGINFQLFAINSANQNNPSF